MNLEVGENMTKKMKKHIMELIIFAGIVLWSINNYKLFIDLLAFTIKILMPLIVGMAIAFLINVPMKQVERKIFKIQKRKHKKLVRILSLIISLVLIFGIVGLIMFLVIPEFIQAVSVISKSLTKNIVWTNELLDKVQNIYPNIEQYIGKMDVKSIINTSFNSAGNLVSIAISFLSSMISRIIMFFISFIISLYILLDKEGLVRQIKKVFHAFFSDKTTDNIVRIVKLSNATFTNFITGQCLDACLIAFLFFILLTLFKLPYALILGVLFAVTALIPYIGAFITLVVGAVLVGVVNPMNIIIYVIIFFIVQQIDENFTYPKIVGKSVGLPALWAFLAALIGGSVFGIIGIILSIPLSSILYALLKDYVNYRIENKK